MTVYGFTGTRRGQTEKQLNAVSEVFQDLEGILHHGACHGADRQAHSLANLMSKVMWPSNEDQYTWAAQNKGPNDIVKDIAPPLTRNRDIVYHAKVVIATPGEMSERLRSGTWATIRLAKKWGRPLFIIYPNGLVEKHN